MNRNYFFSYHHKSDLVYLKQLRNKFANKKFADYGFKDEDLAEASKKDISKKIQHRLWASSVTIVLVGEHTGKSAWIDWEIWYSLQSFKNLKVARRSFKPKGLLAVFLPVNEHNIPKRLQANLESGYAVQISWDELDSLFYEKINKAYSNRSKVALIKNDLPLRDDPKKLFGSDILKNLFSGKWV